MPRMLDVECEKCGAQARDIFVMRVPEEVIHFGDAGECMGTMEEVLLPRSARHAGWSDGDAVVVFRKADGSLSYPMRNDSATPAGCERVVMKSLREVERFEKEHGVRCEAMHYNSGNGAPIIDHIDSLPSIEKRRDSFMRAWNG